MSEWVSESVSQLVSDKGKQWSYSGLIKMPVLCNYISLKSTIYTERAIICPWRSWQIPSLERQLYHARLRLCSTCMSINSPTKKQWTGFLKKRVIVANPVIMWFSSRIKDPWSLIAILVLSLIWISCYATKDLGLAGSPIRCYIVYGCFFCDRQGNSRE